MANDQFQPARRPPASTAGPPARWKLAVRQPDVEKLLVERCNVSAIVATLLANRGLTNPDDARAYLEPRLTDLEDPLAIMDVARGAERLARAIKAREKVVIYGDYDVDGMVGTVVLLNFIRLAGGIVDWFIPDRTKDGYSFSAEAVEAFVTAPEKPSLLITVDHGTSAREPIAALRAGGIEVIVTDHHEPPPLLPEDAVAVINPRRPGDTSRFKDLCGAAVAFKLVWATAQVLSGDARVTPAFRAYLLDAMALVSLATITDVVRLWRDNRILCRHGLRALPASTNEGIRALLRRTNLHGKEVQAVHVGFRIGPRLNAAGRLGLTHKAIDLLTTTDAATADRLAAELEEANIDRQGIERKILGEALKMLEADPPDGTDGICLGSPHWHPGVIGIVASRLVDRHHLPVMLVALNGERGRGSARAPAGIHLRDLLVTCEDHLVGYGGHAGAAGCTVTEASFPAFQAAFRAAAREALAKTPLTRELALDCELPLSAISSALVAELERLAPHGAGNPTALFCTHGLRVAGSPRAVGPQSATLVFHLTDGKTGYRAVAFGRGARLAELRRPNVTLSVAYRLKFDSYREPGSVELEVEDFRVLDA